MRNPKARRSAPYLMSALLAACASPAPKTGADNQRTLKSLEAINIEVTPGTALSGNAEQAIAAYEAFLKKSSSNGGAQQPEAMRRLGDLEMERVEARLSGSAGTTTVTDEPIAKSNAKPANGKVSASEARNAQPKRTTDDHDKPQPEADFQRAITLYRDYLKKFPNDSANDRVLYQMARAYELGGKLEAALSTLDQLVKEFPQSSFRDEAQFRRGELLFTMRNYAAAVGAYGAVLGSKSSSPFYERALYMQGWALFKQGRLEDGLNAFFAVLDAKKVDLLGDGALESLTSLSRADRELLEDTFRVTSLSLENLQGAESIPAYVNTAQRRAYEYRVYEQLAELYLKQERIKDAADTLGAFVRRNPVHPQAPVMQSRVITIYQSSGFGQLALQAKKDYVDQYGARSPLRGSHAAAWDRAQPLVKTHLTELARYYHALAQKDKKPDDVAQAVRWYRALLEGFANDPAAAQSNFLLAELLFENKQFDAAAVEYEKTAYQYPPHKKSADAGYAALLAYAALEKPAGATPSASAQRATAAIDSALRFAKAFASDPRTGAVLANAADKLYAQHDAERAAQVAQQVLALNPPAESKYQRTAALIVANSWFERGAYDKAEQAYQTVLRLTPAQDPSRAELAERLAASAYKQGEQARSANRLREAQAHFDRVSALAPQSPTRIAAQFDSAATLIALKDWPAATRQLEDFRQRYPNHPLQSEVAPKLALAYSEQGQWAAAAAELERNVANQKDPGAARDMQWQAAELYEKGGALAPASKAYERYVQQFREPLDANIEARSRLAKIAAKEGNRARELALLKEVLLADQNGGAGRTARSRATGAKAALALAEPLRDEARKVALVEPLARQLKLKKSKLEEALKAYQIAADYGIAEVTTAATYQIADLYADLARAMLASERPRSLQGAELEQYNVLLEEQAFPFEEKAIETHEVNARLSANGVFDLWVQRSFAELAKLRPVRWGKAERTEAVLRAIR